MDRSDDIEWNVIICNGKPAAGESAAGEKFIRQRKRKLARRVIAGKVQPAFFVFFGADVSTTVNHFKSLFDAAMGPLEFVDQIETGLESHGLKD